MKTSNPRKQAIKAGRLLLTSSTLAIYASGAAHAQQVINDGDNMTVTSVADGETISATTGVTSTVDGAPVVVVANNDVTVDNAGTLATTGVTQTIKVNQGTTAATINNAATGRLEGASRVVNFDGTDATLNNDGVILGTASQRNGAVYANRTSNNITINNSATGSIDAGVEGAAIAIEVGGGGAPRGGSITNAGVIQGRGQASPMGGTAGDGIRFFGPGLAPAYVYEGDITNSGLIASESTQGTVAGIRFANRIGFQGTLTNTETGEIVGEQNGLYFGDADHTGGVVDNDGLILSGSRALNIDGQSLVINNGGVIAGLGNQRNGTVYADSTAQDFVLNNLETGLIDVGAGNSGAGFSVELSAEGNEFTINNDGVILGDSVFEAGSPLAGDGLRFERERVNGMLDGTTTGLFTGTINNSETGAIASLGGGGTTAGIRFVNGVSFSGTINNDGFIGGVTNGLYFGNATPAGGGDFTGAIVNNNGTIESESRALNIDGLGLTINNAGSILGAGDQRNGTVYADSTAQGFVLNNLETGLIDAGMGNDGAGFSVELSAHGNDFTINNAGTIQGRGQAGAGSATAGDGLRFERERVGGMLDGSTTGLFTGTIENSGLIDSESMQGTAAGIRFVNGVSFQGVLNNSGTISGAQNGLYFGNPVAGAGADHTGGVVNNLGTISSGSRALNIDGIGLTVNNSGSILGTGSQRNGTVYSDITAQNFTLNNDGTIDAGEGNQGAGFSAQLASAMAGGNAFTITNNGTIQGRGQASAGAATAGDGLRFERTRNMGVLDGTTDGLFVGDIVNTGVIDSESAQGTAAGIRFVNGVSFQGVIDNSGTISGVQNGLYFGNPTPAGGGDFTQAIVNNTGTISSGSRALNIDGLGLTINNTGSIIGTGDQRNGTIYSDAGSNNFTINNGGLVDAGAGNQGAAISLQLGGAPVDATIVNTGTIQGRGQAAADTGLAGDGIRLAGPGVAPDYTFVGSITNSGLINSESAVGPTAGIRVANRINFQGTLTNEAGGVISGINHGLYLGAGDHSAGIFTNSGTISGGRNSVFAGNALAGVNFVNDGGTLIGNFVGSAFADTLSITGTGNVIQGDILNDVNVTTAAGSSTVFAGQRSLSGGLTHAGTLNFDLGLDSIAVDGNTVLEAGSVINVETTQITSADVGSTIDVLTETGTFTDNGTTVNVLEDDFLLDYTVNLASVSVTISATDLGNVSGDANINSFGSAISSAAANNRLQGDVFTALNGLGSAAEFEAAALTLLPAINDGVTREIYETQRIASSQVQARLRGEEMGLWGEAFFRTADADPTSASSLGYEADTTGFTLGLDGKVGETTTLGVLLNYSDIDVDANGLANASSEIDAFQIGAYAGFDLGQAYLNAELGYSTSSVDNGRLALGSAVTGESDVDGVYASLNAGYDIEAGGALVTPSVGLRYADLSGDTFTENGGLGLTLDSDSAEFLEARIGLRVAGTAETGLIPYASVDYAYDLSSDPLAVVGSFNNGADSFTVIADEASASRFDLSAGLDFVNEGGLSIGAEYRGRFASEYQAHSGGVRVRFAF